MHITMPHGTCAWFLLVGGFALATLLLLLAIFREFRIRRGGRRCVARDREAYTQYADSPLGPLPCPVRFYSPGGPNITSCLPCPGGTICPARATAHPPPCPAGFYCPGPPASAVLPCPANTFSGGGAWLPTACTAVAPPSVQPSPAGNAATLAVIVPRPNLHGGDASTVGYRVTLSPSVPPDPQNPLSQIRTTGAPAGGATVPVLLTNLTPGVPYTASVDLCIGADCSIDDSGAVSRTNLTVQTAQPFVALPAPPSIGTVTGTPTTAMVGVAYPVAASGYTYTALQTDPAGNVTSSGGDYVTLNFSGLTPSTTYMYQLTCTVNGATSAPSGTVFYTTPAAGVGDIKGKMLLQRIGGPVVLTLGSDGTNTVSFSADPLTSTVDWTLVKVDGTEVDRGTLLYAGEGLRMYILPKNNTYDGLRGQQVGIYLRARSPSGEMNFIMYWEYFPRMLSGESSTGPPT